jgi:hypothetical protein
MNKKGLKLLTYLSKELGLSARSIALSLRRQQELGGPLPMVLFELGFISVYELDTLMEWTWTP